MANNPISFVDPDGGKSMWSQMGRNFDDINQRLALASYIGFFWSGAVSDMTLLANGFGGGNSGGWRRRRHF